jgi:hypothetical protein
MKAAACVLLFLTLLGAARAQTNDERTLILVVGAPGAPEYAESFSNAAALWQSAALKGGLETRVIGEPCGQPGNDKQELLETLTNEAAKPSGELWVVFIGHGTYDGHAAKFNLRGPDVTAEEVAAALKPCRRSLAFIQGASASGPFLTALSGSNRVIITATRSGYEVNATRFGSYLAGAIADPAADLDKDGQTSLLEAYLKASRDVAQFYKDQGRLQTEHALLDDNGDGLGTPADWFEGVRAVKIPANGKSVDGVRAHQMVLVRGAEEAKLAPAVRAQRDALEQKLSALRAQKGRLSQDAYYRQVETLVLQIARLYQGK